MIELRIRNFEGHAIQVYENTSIIFGFTEKDFSVTALQRLFKVQPLLFLKQTHSMLILRDNEWTIDSEGDGLILEKVGPVAVIQTADCVPLFYFNNDYSVGGIIHVGWRGLWQGIEKKLLKMLPGNLKKYFFYLGPAIEKSCYPVGEDLSILFKDKPYADSILTPETNGKHLFDLKLGVVMSLLNSGILSKQIQDSGFCNFCLKNRFPSYRRDGKTGKRILNFLALKSNI